MTQRKKEKNTEARSAIQLVCMPEALRIGYKIRLQPTLFAVLLFSTFNFLPLASNAQITSAQPHLTISSFNDNWGGGFTQIKDDLRSFGFMADWQFAAWQGETAQIRTSWSGLTNKFDPEQYRLDELELYMRLPILNFANVWHVDAITGGYVTGDLGGQAFQNKIHELSGVQKLNLRYPTAHNVYGTLGARFWGDFLLTKTADGNAVLLLPLAEYAWAPNYLQNARAEVGFALRNPAADQLQLTLGYAYTDAFAQPTRMAVATAESGAFVQLGMRLGIASLSMTAYPNSNFSTGALGISLLTGRNQKALKNIDMMAEIGALSDANGLYIRYLWNKNGLQNKHFAWDFKYQFWSFGAAELPDYPKQMGHYQQATLGANYHFVLPKPTFQVLPYASLRAGYRAEFTYAGFEAASKKQEFFAALAAELGLRIKLPANFIHKHCYYGFTPSYQYQTSIGKKTTHGAILFGFAGFVMIDF